MLKKLLIGGGSVALLGSLIFGRDVVNYAQTAWSATREAVKREVPLEFQIERARTSVKQLDPAIQHTLKVIAEQQVDLEQMNHQIHDRSADMSTAKEQLMTLKHDLESGKSTFRYASIDYTADDVRRDIRTRFERYKAAEAMLDRDQKIQKSRSVALYAHEKQLDQMLSQKKDLEAEVEQLEARLQTIRARAVRQHSGHRRIGAVQRQAADLRGQQAARRAGETARLERQVRHRSDSRGDEADGRDGQRVG